MITSRRAVFLVGLTKILAAAWVVAIVVYLRGTLAARRVYHVEVVFPDALGIREQARVYLAGVEVGEVQKIWLTTDLQARARLALRRDVVVPEDTVAVVMSPGIAGVDKLIALLPGRSPVPAQEGSVLKGAKEPGLSDIAPVAQRTLQEVQQLVRSVNALLNDTEMQASIKRTLRNVEQASERLVTLTEEARQLLSSTQRSLDTVAADARRTTNRLPTLVDELQGVLQQSRELLRTVQQATTSVERFLNDEDLQQQLRETARQMNLLGERLNRIAEDIGKYTGDEQLRQDVRSTVSEARATLTEARQATEKINRFVERLVRPVELPIQRVEVSLDVVGLLRSQMYRTDLTLTFPYRENRFINLGVYDITESNSFILQYGSYTTSSLGLRYGLYASKPGVGLDWKLTPNISLHADAFRPNDLQINARLRYRLNADWSLWAGLDSLFRDNQPVLGFRLTR
jgi:phospholipid/cholesterol/gamma-HCH transport system substrate-binding protein